MRLRSRLHEWYWFGCAGFLAAASVLRAVDGEFGSALAAFLLAVLPAGVGGFVRHYRKLSEYKARHPNFSEFQPLSH